MPSIRTRHRPELHRYLGSAYNLFIRICRPTWSQLGYRTLIVLGNVSGEVKLRTQPQSDGDRKPEAEMPTECNEEPRRHREDHLLLLTNGFKPRVHHAGLRDATNGSVMERYGTSRIGSLSAAATKASFGCQGT